MSKIDTTSWKEFKISDLFITENKGKLQVPTGATMSKSNLIDGDTPRISVTGSNNGICGYFDSKIDTKDYRVFENFISVSFLGTVFYHPYKASLDMKVHCLKPLNFELNNEIALYLVPLIKNSLKESSYCDQISSTSIVDLIIKLPVKITEEIDFDYMESYISNIESKIKEELNLVKSIEKEKVHKINTSEWKEFKISDLFEIVNGKKYPKSNRESGNLPLISTSSFNNGISDYIAEREDNVYKNIITVAYSGSVGATFYHKNNVFIGETVLGLIPKFRINEEIGLFFVNILSIINKKYSYDHKIKVLSYGDEYIKLPVDQYGNPDYAYMESCQKAIILRERESDAPFRINRIEWREFKISDLFNGYLGKNYSNLSEYSKDSLPYISATIYNNGVCGYISEYDEKDVYTGPALTVGSRGRGDGITFLQKGKFIPSNNVSVLIPKDNNLLNKENALLFISSLLSKSHETHNYMNIMSLSETLKTVIKLPVDINGNPNYEIMENYINSTICREREQLMNFLMI